MKVEQLSRVYVFPDYVQCSLCICDVYQHEYHGNCNGYNIMYVIIIYLCII